MLDYPPVSIQICTYNRPREIRQTLTALSRYLCYEGNLQVVICDDHSPGEYRKQLKQDYPLAQIVDTGKQGGWGVNVNRGLGQIETEYIFFLEDDYVLTEPLDLTIGVMLLMRNEHIGMVRYRGTAGDHLIYHQMETDLSATHPHYREGVGLEGKCTYFLLDGGSPALWIYSNGPHLKHIRFHQFYGRYPEGLRLGQTEESYAHTVKDGMKMQGAPAIAIFPHWINMLWEHIGSSFQNSEFDK